MPREFSSVTFEAEHIPETHRTLENDRTVTEQELPGTVRVYMVIDGARIPFTDYKASKVLEAVDAKQQTQAQTGAQQAQTQPGTLGGGEAAAGYSGTTG